MLTVVVAKWVVARSSFGGIAIRYVLPVLWMTSCFHTVRVLLLPTSSTPTYLAVVGLRLVG